LTTAADGHRGHQTLGLVTVGSVVVAGKSELGRLPLRPPACTSHRV
jgi:hypothetical protein